jgi:radical SAM-linked protein
MAYSAGFSPHPKVSYAGAAPTGVASEAEYVEIAVTERLEPEPLRVALDASLPPGLDVLELVEAAPGALADRLDASVWEIALPGVDGPAARTALDKFLATDVVEVERLTKNGMRRFDARAAVLSADVVADGRAGGDAATHCAILRVVVRHVTPAVRPDDVLAGLRLVADLTPSAPPAVCRLAQGPLDVATGAVGDPLAADKGAVGAAERSALQP